MIEQESDQEGPPAGSATETSGLVDTAREAGAAARERIGELREAADTRIEEAKGAAIEKAKAGKSRTVEEVARTAEGLEAAAEQMEGGALQKDLLREAADGLKQISRAIEGKSLGTIVGELSDFGRRNPVAYLGGAALAGFALARFARASASSGWDDADEARQREETGMGDDAAYSTATASEWGGADA